MGKLGLRYKSFVDALVTLKEAIDNFDKAKKHYGSEQLDIVRGEKGSVSYTAKAVFLAMRDSLILRFKCLVDLMWKYLKDYLQEVVKIVPEVGGPKNVIRTCAQVRLLSEQEAKSLLEMIESRNITSHIYREEIAEQISSSLPVYYELMQSIADKAKPEKVG